MKTYLLKNNVTHITNKLAAELEEELGSRLGFISLKKARSHGEPPSGHFVHDNPASLLEVACIKGRN